MSTLETAIRIAVAAHAGFYPHLGGEGNGGL